MLPCPLHLPSFIMMMQVVLLHTMGWNGCHILALLEWWVLQFPFLFFYHPQPLSNSSRHLPLGYLVHLHPELSILSLHLAALITTLRMAQMSLFLIHSRYEHQVLGSQITYNFSLSSNIILLLLYLLSLTLPYVHFLMSLTLIWQMGQP